MSLPMIAVIVPLDGTANAERALNVWRTLARRLAGELVLVRASATSSERDATAYLDGVVDRFDLEPATTRLVIGTSPLDAVHDVARNHDDAVICLAGHGRSGVGHALLGSTSEEVLAQSIVAAFVVGPEARSDHPDGRSDHPDGEGKDADVRRVGVCIDAATDPTGLVPFCARWAARLGCEVEVLTVHAEDDRPISRFHPASHAQLAEMVALLEANGVRAHGHVLEELQPARALATFAADHDLVLLIANKRSGTGLRRDVLGSTSMNLVRQSPCPVLFPAAVDARLEAADGERASSAATR